MKSLFIFILLSFAFNTYAEKSCNGKLNKEQVLEIFENVLKESIPELLPSFKNGKIIYQEFEGNEYYLGTFPSLLAPFKRKYNRVFKLKINRSLYECPPPLNALKAILVHEAKHFLDYFNAGFPQYIKLGLKYRNKSSRSLYERQTDLYTMEKGYAQGLIEYRKWVYDQLNESELKTKKCFYYTPEEITNWMATKENNLKSYFKEYCH